MKIRILTAIIHLLSDNLLGEIQDLGLAELDRRGLIIWAESVNQNQE
jgi:hypothetical protein